jgi:glycine/D-amino acid oxidase-like deaminating enzyme
MGGRLAELQHQKHIVIVGAGAAGLKAASDLLTFSDYRVTIIEARDRLGLSLGSGPPGSGACWKHGDCDDSRSESGDEDEELIVNPLDALFKAADSVMFDFYSRPPGMFAPGGSALPHAESQQWTERVWGLLDETVVKSAKDTLWRVQVDPMTSLAAYEKGSGVVHIGGR